MKKVNELLNEVDFSILERTIITDYIHSKITDISDYKSNHYFDELIGIPLSLVIFYRTESSFDSAIKLMNDGFIIEANCILRLIFEQLCYSMCISSKPLTEINKYSVTKSINSISQINKNYKLLYGSLSSITHFNIKEFYRVMSAEETSDTSMSISITMQEKEGKTASMNTLLLIILFKMYNQVGIYIFKQLKNEEIINAIKVFEENIKGLNSILENKGILENILNNFEMEKYF